jgi:hypothetical protein
VGKDDNDPHAAWYLNESYPGVDKFSYGISWHGYWKRTLQQLDEQFRSVQMNWKKREEYHWLIAQFKHLKATNKLPVTNVIALGIGSLHDSPHKEWRRHGEQLAAVLTIRETLGGKLEGTFNDRKKLYSADYETSDRSWEATTLYCPRPSIFPA